MSDADRTRPQSDATFERLAQLCELLERSGARAFDAALALELARTVRNASDLLGAAGSGASSPAEGARAHARSELYWRAHAALQSFTPRSPQAWWRRALGFLWSDGARAIRAEWRLGVGVLAALYGLATLAYVAVARDLGVAPLLLDRAAVAAEIEQLRATAAGEPFRGNFTFGLGDAPRAAGWILAHNISIAVVFFGSALIPPLFVFLLATNALMLGTYTAVAAHWNQGWAISSLLWCHGVIELQMIVLAGMAGLVLARAVAWPGPWTRSTALARASGRAWALLAPTFPLLFLSGLIEGFVTPHAPQSVRLAVAAASTSALALWIARAGRAADRYASAPQGAPSGTQVDRRANGVARDHVDARPGQA